MGEKGRQMDGGRQCPLRETQGGYRLGTQLAGTSEDPSLVHFPLLKTSLLPSLALPPSF